MKISVQRIVSGGQTGADRAALDFASEKRIETGGWVPRGRLAEDCKIPNIYENLRETESADSAERTRLNVRDSDATLIFTRGKLTGGSQLTAETAKNLEKPFLHVDLKKLRMPQAVAQVRDFLTKTNCHTLNVAGSRASEDSQIYADTRKILEQVWS